MDCSYKFLKNRVRLYEKQLAKRRQKTIDAIDLYLEENLGTVDLIVKKIDEQCTNCSYNCQLEHYPVIYFVGYFDENMELFATLVINNETKTYKIEVENKGLSVLCKVKGNLGEQYMCDFLDKSNQDIVDFIGTIVSIIPIYLKEIDSSILYIF